MFKAVTYSGQEINFHDLQYLHHQICIDDIVIHLSKVQRFGGATKIGLSYTVAEHCINLARYMVDNKYDKLEIAYALIHDASEYILGDVVSGLKNSIHMEKYRELEKKIQEEIEFKYIRLESWKQHNQLKQVVSVLDKRIAINEASVCLNEDAQRKIYKNSDCKCLTLNSFIYNTPQQKCIDLYMWYIKYYVLNYPAKKIDKCL